MDLNEFTPCEGQLELTYRTKGGRVHVLASFDLEYKMAFFPKGWNCPMITDARWDQIKAKAEELGIKV